MKVSCASCQTTYVVGVEVPAGRALWSECKRCHAPIHMRAHTPRSLAPTLPRPQVDEAQAPHDQCAPPRPLAATDPNGGAFDRRSAPESAPSSFEDEPSFDEAMVASSRIRWCIDRGPTLETMTTFELWLAIASGQIPADVRVWREGLECWTEVERVPELACALVPVSSRTGRAIVEAPRSEGGSVWSPSTPPLVSETDPARLVAMLGADPLAALDQDARDRVTAPWGDLELPGAAFGAHHAPAAKRPLASDTRATLKAATSPTMRSTLKGVAGPQPAPTLRNAALLGQLLEAERADRARMETFTSNTPAAWTALTGGSLLAEPGARPAASGRSRLRSFTARVLGGRSGARWIALGSAAALAMAIAVTGLANAGGLAKPATCATPERAQAAAPEVQSRGPAPTAPSPVPAAPRRPEPGQHRRR
jgi:GYF domain 2